MRGSRSLPSRAWKEPARGRLAARPSRSPSARRLSRGSVRLLLRKRSRPSFCAVSRALVFRFHFSACKDVYSDSMLSLIVLVALASNQDPAQGTRIPLRPPLTREEEISRFFARRKGMSTEERLAGYEKRLALEAQSDFSKLVWRNVGPEHMSGRAIRILAPKDHTDQLLVAFATGGLWRTDDR